jgi:hypothetical protein
MMGKLQLRWLKTTFWTVFLSFFRVFLLPHNRNFWRFFDSRSRNIRRRAKKMKNFGIDIQRLKKKFSKTLACLKNLLTFAPAFEKRQFFERDDKCKKTCQ